ncbi:hypothetical protein NDU88_001956 [Pleurodeles waltl]|uniref:Uncharacterized protein n=1 Tax=Pleurodeles waltl TaxID=8319 RepID=A0AAV7VXW6_PLEWA|nr:hypothetical protein NDU88_001956 [Pleurodeles waltl]
MGRYPRHMMGRWGDTRDAEMGRYPRRGDGEIPATHESNGEIPATHDGEMGRYPRHMNPMGRYPRHMMGRWGDTRDT